MFAWPLPGTSRAPLTLAALDFGAEGAEALVDTLVAAVDLPDVPDRGAPVGAERCDHHGHAGADVRALEPLPHEPGRSGDDGAMRVAEDDPRAHRDELVDEEEPALEHLLEDEHRPRRLRGRDDRDRRQVGGERGPDAALDLRDLAAEVVEHPQPLPRRDAERGVPDLELDPELAERGHDREQVVRLHVLDHEVAPRDRRERGEARNLDVLGADAVRPAAEPLHALDVEHVRADALIRAPSEARKRQRSWMCGSHAACPTTVSPSASTAAMIEFSVAITEASSRYSRFPTRPSA